MAAALVHGHTTIDAMIKRAQAQGMRLCEPDLAVVDEDGALSPVRYLENPKTQARFMLTQFEEGELVGPSICEAMQRRLGITLADC